VISNSSALILSVVEVAVVVVVLRAGAVVGVVVVTAPGLGGLVVCAKAPEKIEEMRMEVVRTIRIVMMVGSYDCCVLIFMNRLTSLIKVL
jgi:hypothetical protein